MNAVRNERSGVETSFFPIITLNVIDNEKKKTPKSKKILSYGVSVFGSKAISSDTLWLVKTSGWKEYKFGLPPIIQLIFT